LVGIAGLASDSAVRLRIRVPAAGIAGRFVGAVMCAAYYAANNPTNDKDDDDDDRHNPPSRAIPRPLGSSGPGTILQLPFFVVAGDGAGCVAFCKWLLVCMLASWNWRGGGPALVAFI
jgi:hypothetical protein